MREKTISIIIPNYNGAAYLAACLASLREDPVPGTDIIVVDNGSTDGSGDLVTVQFPEVRLIRLKELIKNNGRSPEKEKEREV